ncbi:ATP-binding protein [Solibacillus daqui]|uniref:ATP-binding protein n=1 Tax=Solibacillus daqui TaxID=2912187 RepID=UPI0023668F8D|nr:sensor histidine kinase [Solibacillus daqui]
MKRSSWNFRFFKYNMILAIIIIFIVLISAYYVLGQIVEKEIGERAVNVAEVTALHPVVIEGLKKDTTSPEIQEVAKQIQKSAEAEYVVIGDENEIRYAHPVKERIGQRMVGDDNEEALIHGRSYMSIAEGTLGEALRGKAPVFDENRNIIGVVSVGYLYEDIFSMNINYTKNLLLVLAIAIVLSVLLSSYLANKLKKQLLNYEPQEIVKILSERNVILETIREAIIMVDRNGIITLSNQAANDILTSNNSVIGENIKQVLPNTQLLRVMETGKEQLNRVMTINGTKTLVNRIPLVNNGEVSGVVASFRPFEEIDLVANELSQVKQFIESLRAQTHEYNNFLYTISGLIQLNEYEEALYLIHSERLGNHALIAFINEHIKDMFINGLIIGFYNRAKELKVTLVLDEDSSCGKLGHLMEKHMFISILGNLMTNAFEAVEHLEEEERIIRIYIYESEKEVICEIEDSGEGIREDQMKEIFKLKSSTKDKDTRGYGLHIVQDNLKALNGTIAIEKGDLGGALFIVSIPKEG